MPRHLPQPLHTRILVFRVRLAGANIDPARDGVIHDDLFLLLQQRNQLLLGADLTLNAAGSVVQEADDGGLFGEGWKGHELRTEIGEAKIS